MTSDNDGDSAVASSGCSGCPSPAAAGAKTGRAAGAAKGILVHNNKKSGNTNRVSFVTNSSATASSSSSSSSSSLSSSPSSSLSSSSPSPSVERSKKKYNRRSAADGDGDDAPQSPYRVRSGRRPTGFGVKSYLHEFYDDPDGCESFQGGGGSGGDDDFKYFVEPEIHWYSHCSGLYVVLGLAVMAVGAIALAAGHLIPAKDPVVGRSAQMEVIDRRAVSFNDHLASCRYIGSVVFAVGVVFTVVRFWASVIRGGGGGFGFGGGGGDDGEDRAAKKLRAVEERPSPATAQRPQTVRIPITGTLENVQPDPTAIRLQFADSS